MSDPNITTSKAKTRHSNYTCHIRSFTVILMLPAARFRGNYRTLGQTMKLGPMLM